MIEILPITWENGPQGLVARDQGLLLAALAFMTEELGEDPARDLRRYLKVWVVAELDGATLKRVNGVICVAWAIDVPVYHMRAPDAKDTLAVRDFARGYKTLYRRAKEFLIDQGNGGTGIFVHVSRESRNAAMLEHALKDLNAVEANRVIAKI